MIKKQKQLILKIIMFVVAALATVLFVRALVPARTPLFTDDRGKKLPGSIASLEKVELGGMEQWILIRGRDLGNPVLLWLHGGPGAAQIPIARYFNGELEDHFIVVHWDQRGTGKSNPRNFDEQTMTFNNFLSDAHELTQYLKNRLQKEKIFLLGHSWGTQLGIRLADAYPQDYYAYIAVSQTVHAARAGEIAYAWLQVQVERGGRQKDLRKLASLGQPPYHGHNEYVDFAGMVTAYGGGMDMGLGRLATIALRSPEYNIGDYLAWLRGATRGSGPMWEETRSFNMFVEVPRLLVPVYFFSGENDYNTPIQLVEEYYAMLDAPAGKHLVRFEHSGHAPFMLETARFNYELIHVKEVAPRV